MAPSPASTKTKSRCSPQLQRRVEHDIQTLLHTHVAGMGDDKFAVKSLFAAKLPWPLSPITNTKQVQYPPEAARPRL